MNNQMLDFLLAIHEAGGLEILDSEEPDISQAMFIDHALREKLIQDQSSGWNASSTYVLTRKGVEAITLG